MVQGIYLLHTRACINASENVYKIGKSINIKRRMKSYDKGSILKYHRECPNDLDKVEKQLIKFFSKKFKIRTDYGREYFEGKLEHMIAYIDKYFDKYGRGNVSDKKIIEKKINIPPRKNLSRLQCERCCKIFKQKIDYIRHINRKNKCEIYYEYFQCDWCNKNFTNKQNLNRHKKTVCIDPTIQKEITIDEIKEQMTNLHNQFVNLVEKL